jgi:hypothetical protein
MRLEPASSELKRERPARIQGHAGHPSPAAEGYRSETLRRTAAGPVPVTAAALRNRNRHSQAPELTCHPNNLSKQICFSSACDDCPNFSRAGPPLSTPQSLSLGAVAQSNQNATYFCTGEVSAGLMYDEVQQK